MATLPSPATFVRTLDAGFPDDTLRLTPGEWRRLLEDSSFLSYGDNSFQSPRRYAGRPVEIVPAVHPSQH